jgi:hypothetical protein
MVSYAEPLNHCNPFHNSLMLEGQSPIDVYLRVEPPIRWPLWFSDFRIIDVEDQAPLSLETKRACRELSEFFESKTGWCSIVDASVWDDEIDLLHFNRMALEVFVAVANELGQGFKVHGVYARTSVQGHSEMLRLPLDEADAARETNFEGILALMKWHKHTCLGRS